ncbi:MAG: DsbA family oxidoreductase [Phototrophicaceae bacterium]
MNIDVFHDIACPWCRIGKAHLQEALSQWDSPVNVSYHPFLLNAAIPKEGVDFKTYMLAKGNHRVPLEQFFAAPRTIGASIGLTFNFEMIQYAPNTFDAHRLIAMVDEDKQTALIDALYTAYFEDGRNIGALVVLADIAHELGLERSTIYQQLVDGVYQQLVETQLTQAQQVGITGVPLFVFNNQFTFSGAQSPQTILNVMRQAQGAISSL